MANNKSDRPDKMYVKVLTVRLSEEEYAQLEKMASDDGRPISIVARQLLFGRNGQIPSGMSDGDAKYKTLLAVQQCRQAFKKISSRINEAVGVYDHSLDVVDERGEKVVSTSQTIRHIKGLVEMQLVLQKNLNLVLDSLGVQPVYYAARPSRDSRVGELINAQREAERISSEASKYENGKDKKDTARIQDGDNREIPKKYRYMFRGIATGKIIEDAQEFTTKKGTVMMRFKAEVHSFMGGEETVHIVHVIRVKNGQFPFIKAGRSVTIIGELGIKAVKENDELKIEKTIYADEVSFP